MRQKFGVPPASIPDWLALVGDSADGYPGLPGWGARSAATVLARYRPSRGHSAPGRRVGRVRARRASDWPRRSPSSGERALLFRTLATLRTDAPIGTDVDALRWLGPRPGFAAWSERLGPPSLQERAAKLADVRARPSTA